MPKPKICPQGEYDGACFLYSVTNAYKTLTGKHPTFNMWDNAVEHIPFRDDFIRNIGTYWYDDNMGEIGDRPRIFQRKHDPSNRNNV